MKAIDIERHPDWAVKARKLCCLDGLSGVVGRGVKFPLFFKGWWVDTSPMPALVVILVGVILWAILGLRWAGLRREIALWRWRHRHPALIQLRVPAPPKKRRAAA